MSAATLSALVLVIALPVASQPATDAKPALLSKTAVLAEIFQAHLTPEQAAKLKQQTPEEMARLFIPPQKEAARLALIERAAVTKDAEQLAELGRGHLLLGDTQGLVETGAQMAQLHPGESRGFTMMGQGLAKQGKDSEALAVVNRALELNPNDDGAKGLRVLIESRRRFGGRGAATPATSAPARTIEAAMVTLPNAAAYKAAVAMGGESGATVADSARRALSDLRPTASRHVPLNVTGAEDPAPKTPWDGAKAAGLAAAATMGSLLMFLGLFPKRLDQKYPWLKPSMAGGVLLAGAVISYDLAASHFIYGRYVAWKLSASSAVEGTATVTAQAAPAAQARVVTQQGAEMTEVFQEVAKRGEIFNRLWHSDWRKGVQGPSGPEGRSFCRGACLPINASRAVEGRGLNAPGVVNNAQRGALYRVKEDIVVTVRRSIGGYDTEILIKPEDFSKLEIIEDTISVLPPGPK